MATGASAPPLTVEELEQRNLERLQAANISLSVSALFREAESAWRVGNITAFNDSLALLPGIRTEGEALGMFTGRGRGRGRGGSGGGNPTPGGGRP